MKTDSIWLELAARAWNGEFERVNNPSANMIREFINREAPARVFNHWVNCTPEVNPFYIATPEEQCLLLLFVGEMYESEQ